MIKYMQIHNQLVEHIQAPLSFVKRFSLSRSSGFLYQLWISYFYKFQEILPFEKKNYEMIEFLQYIYYVLFLSGYVLDPLLQLLNVGNICMLSSHNFWDVIFYTCMNTEILFSGNSCQKYGPLPRHPWHQSSLHCQGKLNADRNQV